MRTKLGYLDKIVTTQPNLCELYSENLNGEDYSRAVARACLDFSKEFNPPAHYANQISGGFNFEWWSTPPNMLALMDTLIQLRGVRCLLEVGALTGHTAIRLREMLPVGGFITTIEINETYADQAQANIDDKGYPGSIHILRGDATVFTRELVGPFDMVFLDGCKENYLKIALQCVELLSERGVMVIDDIFFQGDALNQHCRTDKGRGCQLLRYHFRDRADFHKCLLPIGNGVMLLVKK